MAYCAATGASVSSWGRSPRHNDFVGGLATSYHLTWNAADVEYDFLPEEKHAKRLAKHLELELTREPDHDHLEPFP